MEFDSICFIFTLSVFVCDSNLFVLSIFGWFDFLFRFFALIWAELVPLSSILFLPCCSVLLQVLVSYACPISKFLLRLMYNWLTVNGRFNSLSPSFLSYLVFSIPFVLLAHPNAFLGLQIFEVDFL